ncbi:cathepsin l1-like [Lynx pardinus]|uniref:Procathepsin L n=1 Tax=Lynx pardinus TaxID=191816 RepID=A0A485N411_LYNPA|nr:cathepsin l1-like [Lynx pardinus]
MIEQHNQEYDQGKHSFMMAMSDIGDMIPSSVDWREKGYVTPVKDQVCGLCWVFSATGALEGQMFQTTGKLVSLSEQNLVDCSLSKGNGGFSGGLVACVFQYVKENGVLGSDRSYPYPAQDESCLSHNPEYSAADVTVSWESMGWEIMITEATVDRLSYCHTSCGNPHPSTEFYFPGIYYDSNCSHEILHHGVLIVGYGFEGTELDNKKYWIVKNSWGEAWGIDGYILMAKDRDNHCGIASLASFPTV